MSYTDSDAPIGREVIGSILQQIGLGVALLDEQARRLLYCNPQAASALGTGSEAAAAELVAALVPGGLESLTAKWGQPQVARAGDRLVGFTAYRLPGALVCLFLRDITERQRQESLSEASSWAESLDTLFSSIRHEIANPLNAIKMTLSVLKQNINRFPPAATQDYLARALGEVAKLESLMRALKSFSMFGAPHIQSVALGPFLEAFVASKVAGFREHGIELALDYEDEPCTVCADPIALQTVLANVVANAADALAGVERPTVRIRVRRALDLEEVTVADNGCGILDEHKPRLFEPFFTTKPNATGLGLVTSRKLLAQIGGAVEVASQPGVGTEVRITLPAFAPEAAR